MRDAWKEAKMAHENLIQARKKRHASVEALNFAQSRYQQTKVAMDSFVVAPLSAKELKENQVRKDIQTILRMRRNQNRLTRLKLCLQLRMGRDVSSCYRNSGID